MRRKERRIKMIENQKSTREKNRRRKSVERKKKAVRRGAPAAK
jgi:hypothetical protein